MTTPGGPLEAVTDLERLYCDLIEQLHHQLARHRDLGAFQDLDDASKDVLIEDVRIMCHSWSTDPELRGCRVPGHDAIVDLVAEQYRVGQAIAAARRQP